MSNGIAVGALVIGGLFVYGAVAGKSPLAAGLAVVQGSSPATVNPTQQIGQDLSQPPGAGSSSQADAGTPGTGAVSGTAEANQAIGKMLAAPYGWASGQEWNDLVSLWDMESGWRNTADTRVSGAGGDGASSSVFAYGIAQARPATKYPKAGQPPDLGGSADPHAQIAWGLSYIKGRYGSPSAAWAHETANHWY